MKKRKIVFAQGITALMLAVGCGGVGREQSQEDPLPARPQEVRLDGVDPCQLMPPEVLRDLDIPSKFRPVRAAAPGLRNCAWERDSLQRPSGSVNVTTAIQQNVRNVLDISGARITAVAGYGAVELQNDEFGARANCDIRVDVADGQGLWVQYVNILGDEPGATHALMCERAHRAAEGVMQQLLANRK